MAAVIQGEEMGRKRCGRNGFSLIEKCEVEVGIVIKKTKRKWVVIISEKWQRKHCHCTRYDTGLMG